MAVKETNTVKAFVAFVNNQVCGFYKQTSSKKNSIVRTAIF